jgi:dihydrodipicolinate synthase/N-acetylneuraminate lyase
MPTKQEQTMLWFYQLHTLANKLHPRSSRDSVTRLQKKSPLLIIIYNFPAVCNGIDLDSERIATIAAEDSNVVGAKLTCAEAGTIVMLPASLKPEEFSTFDGQSDFLGTSVAGWQVALVHLPTSSQGPLPEYMV